jgi:hypothetical protein
MVPDAMWGELVQWLPVGELAAFACVSPDIAETVARYPWSNAEFAAKWGAAEWLTVMRLIRVETLFPYWTMTRAEAKRVFCLPQRLAALILPASRGVRRSDAFVVAMLKHGSVKGLRNAQMNRARLRYCELAHCVA